MKNASILSLLALVIVMTFAATPATAIPVCGDNFCNTTAMFPESCSTCPQDCGSCPPPPPTCEPDYQKVSGSEQVCHIRSHDGSVVWRDTEALFTDVNSCQGSQDEYRLYRTDTRVCFGLTEWNCCVIQFGSSQCFQHFHNDTCQF